MRRPSDPADNAGQVEFVAGTTRDISGHKRTEDALRESEQRLRTLAESLEFQVQARTAELEQRNADVVRASQELRELSARLMHTQDQERRHIGRELHDSAGQTLAVLGMHLAQLAREVKPRAAVRENRGRKRHAATAIEPGNSHDFVPAASAATR